MVKVSSGFGTGPIKNDRTIKNISRHDSRRMKEILDGIHYQTLSLISSQKQRPLFTDRVAERLAPLLSKALNNSKRGQRVRFVVSYRGKRTAGVCFARGGRLVFLLDEIRSVPFISRDAFRASEIEISRGNDYEESAQSWKLTPQKGQRRFIKRDVIGIQRAIENAIVIIP